MSYLDFNAVFVGETGYIDLYELEVGNYFMEDTYADVYEVISIGKKQGYSGTVIEAKNIENGEVSNWFYDTIMGRAYAPCLILLEKP